MSVFFLSLQTSLSSSSRSFDSVFYACIFNTFPSLYIISTYFPSFFFLASRPIKLLLRRGPKRRMRLRGNIHKWFQQGDQAVGIQVPAAGVLFTAGRPRCSLPACPALWLLQEQQVGATCFSQTTVRKVRTAALERNLGFFLNLFFFFALRPAFISLHPIIGFNSGIPLNLMCTEFPASQSTWSRSTQTHWKQANF